VNVGHADDLTASTSLLWSRRDDPRFLLVDANGNGSGRSENSGLTNVMVVLLNSNSVAVATNYTDSTANTVSRPTITGHDTGSYVMVERTRRVHQHRPTNNRISVTVAAGQTTTTTTSWTRRLLRAEQDLDESVDVRDDRRDGGIHAFRDEYGDVVLNTLRLDDTFDTNVLNFVSATPRRRNEHSQRDVDERGTLVVAGARW